MNKIICVQINEVNFDYIDHYIADGKLPNFAKFFSTHGYVRTTSESEHHLANPWIQWPTFHTGLDYKDHKVFRTGDIIHCKEEMLYEILEKNNKSVATLSPFNAKNTTKNASYFIPDPWTKTPVTGSKDLVRLYDALCQVTDDYAKNSIAPKAALNLILGGLPNLQWKNLGGYISGVFKYFIQKQIWQRAVVCDRLLADTFITQLKKHKSDFSSVFLNCGAHLQHHYLFSSPYYKGPRKSPKWHVKPGLDPLYDAYKLYDDILGDLVSNFGKERIMLVSGLRQAAHERETFYYRLDDHEKFLNDIGLEYKNTYRLMTEDFIINFDNIEKAKDAEKKLSEVVTFDCENVFYVETGDQENRTLNTAANIFQIENRGDSLYLQLKPSAKSLTHDMSVKSGNTVINNFQDLISFAQYKNTHHEGDGYYADSAKAKGELPEEFPLKNVFAMILDNFGIKDDNPKRQIEQHKDALLRHSGE